MSSDNYGLLLLEFILLLILICGSAFFSSCEMSLFSLSRAKVAAYKNDSSPAKRRIHFLLDNYNRTLVCIILANMFANSCISMLNDTLIHDVGLTGIGATVASAASGILILLLFGEVTPMTLAYVYCDSWSKVVSLPVVIMRKVLFPIVYLAEHFSNMILDFIGRRSSEPLTLEEYDSYIETCAKHGAFSDEETQFLKDSLDFSSRSVAGVMLGRTSFGFIRETASAQEVSETIYKFKRMFFPVGRRNPDDADRIFSVKDFFALPVEKRDVWLQSSCVRDAVFIPEQTSVILAMRTLRNRKIPAALISDEYGGVKGLVSLSGIYSALTGGSIGGEKSVPTEPIMQDSEKHIWQYDGLTPFDSVLNDTGWEPEAELESATLNGVFCELYGSMPQVGAVTEDAGFRIRVLELSGKRASKLEVEQISNDENDCGEGEVC